MAKTTKKVKGKVAESGELAIQWKAKRVALKNLKEWPKNPRKLTEKGIERLTESIRRFGLAEPIVANLDGVICGGHGRKKALQNLGVTHVLCNFPDRKLTGKEFEELNIRLNKNIAGEWDHDKLANEFELEELIDWGFEKFELLGTDDEGEGEEEENSGSGEEDAVYTVTVTFGDEPTRDDFMREMKERGVPCKKSK